ncbi:(2Fe-2S)-binding protein [Leucobacter albus]|uniref:(2Fe-2S)-binding protein n=1 Tax=Leucobacter albus TaxID=272210 RepID=A0ABW3TRM6_9MICO
MNAQRNSRPTGASSAGEIRATFEGERISCAPGASVAAALIATGKRGWRETRTGATRGLFCGIGVCFDCIVEIDGESGQRSCMIPLTEGMDVRAAQGPGEAPHAVAAHAGAAPEAGAAAEVRTAAEPSAGADPNAGASPSAGAGPSAGAEQTGTDA